MTDYKFSEMTLEERCEYLLDKVATLEKIVAELTENQDTFAKKWYTDKKSNTKL